MQARRKESGKRKVMVQDVVKSWRKGVDLATKQEKENFGTKCSEKRAKCTEKRTKCTEKRAKYTEMRAKCTEKRAKCTEKRAKCTEKRAERS
eukprot:844280-Rhodomonas_salina.1